MDAIATDTIITRAQDLLATQVDGETVLMDVATGKYFGLARTAQVIWQQLEAPTTFGALCAQLQDRYAGAGDTIAADTHRFVLHLAQQKLVTLS